LHIHVWKTWMMGFRILFVCWWASLMIILQKPSNVPPCTSTCSEAPFWKPSNFLIYSQGTTFSTPSKRNGHENFQGTPSSRICTMVMRISKANPLWVFTDTPLENGTQI
jgi:hypothetical protein